MRNIYPMFLTLIVLLGALGCDSAPSNQDANATLSPSEKQFIKQLFDGPYLWYDHANTSIDPSPYSTPQALIDAYKYTERDRWSFAFSEAEFNDFIQQGGSGFGIMFSSDMTIKAARIDSPAWGKIQRGDRLLSINGSPATAERLYAASQSLGSSATFKVARGDANLTVTVTPTQYTYHVSLDRIYHMGGRAIGYLRYDSFSQNSDQELASRFADFDAAGIDDLIVDLRYNGGGVVGRAIDLMGYINNTSAGSTAVTLAWNDRYSAYDQRYTFPDPAHHSLALSRVFFLATKRSASASELAINGLVPYLAAENVITIGTATHGKNVGMSGVKHGGYYYFLINFYVKNAIGSISPSTGIPPTCPAEDDLGHALGDVNETMLSTALYYLQHDTCPPSASSRRIGSDASSLTPLLIDGKRPIEGLIAP